jgi:hypothetical protein
VHWRCKPTIDQIFELANYSLEKNAEWVTTCKEIIALSEEKKLLKKITRPDTLTVENALGKVWYDKSNNKVEFFTHYGKHPENGKALKDVSETILEKYAKK